MDATTLTGATIGINPAAPAVVQYYEDPLDEDEPSDAGVTTSRRGLIRLALVAAETGSRFQREGVGHDPMAWMLASRRLFEGGSAIEACLTREHCLRAILLHGLSLGLDAAPAAIDSLIAYGPVPDGPDDPWSGGDHGGAAEGASKRRRLRLYSAMIVVARGGELLHAFHASVAPSAAVVRERIRARLGSAAAEQAEIMVGFDPDCPAAMGMVPPAMLDTLARAGRRTRSASLAGLDITVEQRIPS